MTERTPPSDADPATNDDARIAAAAAAVAEAGFFHAKVSAHGDVARVCLNAADLARCAAPAVRDELAACVRATGFRFVALDLDVD